MRLRLLLSLFGVFLTACLSLPPPHPRALECNELCARYFSQGDLTKAEVQCDLGLQFSPQYADLWVNKGLIAHAKNDIPAAKDFYIKALRYNQEQSQAYNNLGAIYLEEHSYGRARDNFARALKVNPDYLQARNNLAKSYKGLGDRDRARKEFRTLVEIDNNLANPHAGLGELFYEEKNYEEAIRELRQAVQLSPSFAEAWGMLGLAYSELGQFREAKDAFTACLEFDPKNIQCLQNAPVVERKAKLLEPTLNEAKANAATEKTPAALLALAKNYQDRGLKNEEERAYLKCLQADPKHPTCHYGLFELYRDDGRNQQAIVACKNFKKFADAVENGRELEICSKYLLGHREVR